MPSQRTSQIRALKGEPALAESLLETLRAAAVKGRAEAEKRYLKSSLVHFGTPLPAIRRAAQKFKKEHPALSRERFFGLLDDLWGREIHEARVLVVELLDSYGSLLEAGDIDVLERYLRESNTWALVDSLSASVVGPLVERCPSLRRRIERWAGDEDFWIRRSALLAWLIPLREGRGDLEEFGKLAEPMLPETEFFIRKAIGWVLRDTSRRRPGMVSAWLRKRANRASGLTVREAVKHLSERDRAAILAVHASSRAGAEAKGRGRGKKG